MPERLVVHIDVADTADALSVLRELYEKYERRLLLFEVEEK